MFLPQHPRGGVGEHNVIGTYPGVDDGVPGIESYEVRGLPLHLNSPEDTVRLPTYCREAVSVWSQYVVNDLEIAMPEVVYEDERGALLNGANAHRPALVFKRDGWAVELRPEWSSLRSVDRTLDHKGRFLRLMEKSNVNVPYPPTTYCDGLAGAQKPVWGGKSCWVKPSVGASGIDGRRVRTEAEFKEAVAALDDYQVQEHVPGTICSVQLWVDEIGPRILMTTDQIMSGQQGNEHMGNMFPSQYDRRLRTRAQYIGRIVHELGYRGYCGLDFVVSARETLVLEMNPRLTGAHYPGAMAGHLQFSEWMHISVGGIWPYWHERPADFMTHMKTTGLLWSLEKQQGAVPWCIGPLSAGKVMLLIPGDRDRQLHVLQAFQKTFCSS